MKNFQGVITRVSPFDVKETTDRLVVYIERNGATVYSRINQQNEVRHAGREILPLEFILFGNPINGGAIIAANPVAALDLPLKLIVWKEPDQLVRVCFNDPAYIQQRYSLPGEMVAPLNLEHLISAALD